MTHENLEALQSYQKLVTSEINDNYIKAGLLGVSCPDHPGVNTYFERVRGQVFQCAHISHKEASSYNSSNLPSHITDR